MQNQNMHFVISNDSKPRLKWTHELHQRFIDATNQLGGANKATPKSLMKVMEIPGLTLYHLKSHLQKYRLGKRQEVETCPDNKQQDCTKTKICDEHCSKEINVGDQNQITENMDIAHALEMQMKVEKKLYEQIEVQKHLQLRIEAQGKYLQSVLMKAQESLFGHNSSSIGIKNKKDELSQLVTMINNACPSSPISELTESRGFGLNYEEVKQDNGAMCSLECSLTSCESTERKEEKNLIQEIGEFKKFNTSSLESAQFAMQTEVKSVSCPMSVSVISSDDSCDKANGRKRNAETEFDDSYVENSLDKKKCGNKLKKVKLSEMFDLNIQCHNDMDSTSSKTLDLNCAF